MWWEPIKLNRTWDTRWDAEQCEHAVLRADEQLLAARANLDAAIGCVKRATEQYAEAVQWMGTARRFAGKSLPEIPDPPAVEMGQKHPRDIQVDDR
jgi:hypothetical protein